MARASKRAALHEKALREQRVSKLLRGRPAFVERSDLARMISVLDGVSRGLALSMVERAIASGQVSCWITPAAPETNGAATEAEALMADLEQQLAEVEAQAERSRKASL